MFGLFGEGDGSGSDRARLRRVEKKLDLILAHLGIAAEPAGVLSAEVIQLAAAGRKIEAIAAHRRQTGAGLAEAKAAVEEYAGGR